jgi:hypothetical protein
VKTVTISNAIEIVLELARDAIMAEETAKTYEWVEYRNRQIDACHQLEDFASFINNEFTDGGY